MLWRAGASARVLERNNPADTDMLQMRGDAKGTVWAGDADGAPSDARCSTERPIWEVV